MSLVLTGRDGTVPPVATPDPFAPLLANPGRSGILTDFDGSLSPIVADPMSARPVPGAPEAMAHLATVFGRVAVISGRPLSFLRRVLGSVGVVLVGQYGMERLVDGEVELDPAVEPWVGAAVQAATELERALPGLYVERKGEISCVVHWRTSPAREEEALALARDIAERHGLAAQPGRMSIEVRPPVAINKGTSVEGLAGGLDAVLFAGDDRGDLDAFRALDRMVADGRITHGVKLAVQSEEIPAELLQEADERVAGPEELVRVFDHLARAATEQRRG